MKHVFTIGLLVAILTGCTGVPHKPLDTSAQSALRGQSLVTIQRQSPDFIAMTGTKGMFAVAGVGAAVAEGNRMVKESAIVDPADDIASKLAASLSTRYTVKNRGKSSGVSGSNDLQDVVKLANGSSYALDVATVGWQYMYDGFNFSDYFVTYTADLRLIDVKNSSVVAEGRCTYDPKKAGKAAVSHETLLKNDAAFIKKELATATDFCVREFGSLL